MAQKPKSLESLAKMIEDNITFDNSVKGKIRHKGEEYIAGTDRHSLFSYTFLGEKINHRMPYDGESQEELLSLALGALNYHIENKLINAEILEKKGESITVHVYNEFREIEAAHRNGEGEAIFQYFKPNSKNN